MTERATFGLEMRRARERAGLTLDQIAEQTKVKRTLFADLERNDFSRWPSGIFRRAHVRSYAAAVGLEPDDVVSRFVHYFPDPDPELQAAAAEATALPAEPRPTPTFRLVLDHQAEVAPSRGLPVARRVAAGVVDLLLAVGPGAFAAVVAGHQWFWTVTACLGGAGHLLTFGILGTTPGGWLIARHKAVQPITGRQRSARREPLSPLADLRRQQAGRHGQAAARPVVRTRRVSH
jgi:transcriptional regulator with XRE-family HTH domain